MLFIPTNMQINYVIKATLQQCKILIEVIVNNTEIASIQDIWIC